MPERYVELHAHSSFSMLDGASLPEALLDRALALGMPALALADHQGLYGVPRFVLAARARGIHPVVGAELMLENERHLVLLAENQEGYANLCWLISRAQLRGEKHRARLPLNLLRGRTKGLIALTGCRNGVVAGPLRGGRPDLARATLRELQGLFGPGQLYVELQRHREPEEEGLIAALADLAHQFRLPLVATNNVHYAAREGHRLHDVLTAIGHNATLADAAARRVLHPNSERYLKSAGEMAALFSDYPEALTNTLEIAERCQVEVNFRGFGVPDWPVPEGKTVDGCLEARCLAALERRYGPAADAARHQLEHELDVIRETGLAGYFLVVGDIMRFARERGILAQGRGSAANSIVAYLLGITRVDPLEHNLLFERFLSTETRIMPDIDLDFCACRREEVIQYLYDKYGESHVGMVCNFVTYRWRSAVRDVGKALDLPKSLIDRLAKMLGKWGEGELEDAAAALLATPEGVSGRTWEQFLSLCREIQGLPRHLSIHVGGMCITRAPLDELVPLERATMPGRVVIQWDKDEVEDAGLIKIDILSLRTLSAVAECLTLAKELHGQVIDLDTIPTDDPDVYRALQRADTVGAFQVESRAQQQALVKMKPACLADIVVVVALIRPGPLQGNMVHPYLRRRQGLEPVRHLHPMLAPILNETLGVVVFQEQVIRIAMAMGGFSAGEADLLRRAMSRHRSEEEMTGFCERFVAGAVTQGIPEGVAREVFSKLAGFASYGFCKSHAAAFGRLAYETLYLRRHFPVEYYCGLFNSQPMGFYPPRVLVGDARRHGVRVLPVHINRSQDRCVIEGGAIRLGFRHVDGLGDASIARILEVRRAGAYRDLADFCRRSGLARGAVEKLILAGAMDEWERDRRRMVWRVGRLRYAECALDLLLPDDDPPLEAMSYAEELIEEYAIMGLSASGHLMEIVRERLDRAGVLSSQELEDAAPGQRVKVAGMIVVRQAPPTAKGMVFLTLEDEWGLMNIMVRPQVYQAQRSTWAGSLLLLVQGQVERANGRIDVMAERAQSIQIP